MHKRFISESDVSWFNKTIKRLVDEEVGSEYLEYVTKDEIFCSFLR